MKFNKDRTIRSRVDSFKENEYKRAATKLNMTLSALITTLLDKEVERLENFNYYLVNDMQFNSEFIICEDEIKTGILTGDIIFYNIPEKFKKYFDIDSQEVLDMIGTEGINLEYYDNNKAMLRGLYDENDEEITDIIVNAKAYSETDLIDIEEIKDDISTYKYICNENCGLKTDSSIVLEFSQMDYVLGARNDSQFLLHDWKAALKLEYEYNANDGNYYIFETLQGKYIGVYQMNGCFIGDVNMNHLGITYFDSWEEALNEINKQIEENL